MMWRVMRRCRRHARFVEAFFDERERVVLGIDRLRRRDRSFDRLFVHAEKRVMSDGVPPMFTLRPALRDLQRRGDASSIVPGVARTVDRANAELRVLLDLPEWVSPRSVGWTGAFAAAALVAH